MKQRANEYTEVRTVISHDDGTETVEWSEYPTYQEAVDLLTAFAAVSCQRYGADNVTHDRESVAVTKPNGVYVRSYIHRDTERFEVI